MIDLQEVILQAKKELKEEQFRLAVDKEKERLRNKRSLWDVVFPWRIVIIRKGDCK